MDLDKNKNLDWNLCAICQVSSNVNLECPGTLIRKNYDPGNTYGQVASVIKSFQAYNALPTSIPDQFRLLDENILSSLLTEKKAKFHKPCKDHYAKNKLEKYESSRKRKLREPYEPDEVISPPRLTRSTSAMPSSSSSSVDLIEEAPPSKVLLGTCFFCDKLDCLDNLRKVMTFKLDRRVRICARLTNNTLLAAKLEAGDLMVLDALYHVSCLCDLYRKAESSVKANTKGNHEKEIHSTVLSELVAYIEESSFSNNVVRFKLADLRKMYEQRLAELGIETKLVHSTRLKHRILSQFEDMREYVEGKYTYLVFDSDISAALRIATSMDCDDEAATLSKAARIIRRDIFGKENAPFTGSFSKTCQNDFVPRSLKSLMNMIMNGSSITDQLETKIEQPILSASQIIMTNAYVKRRKQSLGKRVSKKRESPLSIFIGLMLHAKTRKRSLVMSLYNLGLSIHYDSVLKISAELGNNVTRVYQKNNIVFPMTFLPGYFMTASVDNIDHQPSSTFCNTSFHGTALCVNIHNLNEPVEDALVEDLNEDGGNTGSSKLLLLPESYTDVPPIVIKTKELKPPKDEYKDARNHTVTAIPTHSLEEDWLLNAKKVIDDETSAYHDNSSWSAFNASKQESAISCADQSVMLPLFRDDSKSHAMIKHSMDVLEKAVHHLNPAQTVVIAFDQPLFTLAKIIQWTFPSKYGSDKFIIMMGGLHIEMLVLKLLGDWLEDSGWATVIHNAGITEGAGTADSFLKGSHVAKTKLAHQLTFCALQILLQRAYENYRFSCDDEADAEDFAVWSLRRENESPHFKFWAITTRMQLTLMTLTRSFRERNFKLYKEALRQILPWAFALDHVHYARWLPVHYLDMIQLETTNPELYAEFDKGNFTVTSVRNFSAIPIDHKHEQNNKKVKGDGGAIGLTENSSELLRWMVCGPEVARVVEEFEEGITSSYCNEGNINKHHEQTKSKQKLFKKNLKSLVKNIEKLGNPFKEEGDDLLVLDTKELASEEVVETVKSIEKLGSTLSKAYLENRLLNEKDAVSSTIHMQGCVLFSTKQCVPSKKEQQVKSLKNDVALFSKLFIACQSRNEDLEEFFSHENQACPPAISKDGAILHSNNKSDLLTQCIEPECVDMDSSVVPNCDAIVVDAPVVVNSHEPFDSKTFKDYSSKVFIPFVTRLLEQHDRVDLVWDEYFEHSLKSSTRAARGKGKRRRVLPDTRIPKDWHGFLRVDGNKKELYAYLADTCIEETSREFTNKLVISTKHEVVLHNQPTFDASSVSPCNHEEADTRIILHVFDAVKNGLTMITVYSKDTDVVVICVGKFGELRSLNIQELWVLFPGKSRRYIPIHQIYNSLGPKKSIALPQFHALTGCDQVSFFVGRGKKTFWQTWKHVPELTDALIAMRGISIFDITDVFIKIQCFFIVSYERGSTCR